MWAFCTFLPQMQGWVSGQPCEQAPVQAWGIGYWELERVLVLGLERILVRSVGLGWVEPEAQLRAWSQVGARSLGKE